MDVTRVWAVAVDAADVRAVMGSYRKRPIVIEAFQWVGDTAELDLSLGLNWGRADAKDVAWDHDDAEELVVWNSAERIWLPVPLDHWIIRGVQGEFYPCKPDIFEATYERLAEPA